GQKNDTDSLTFLLLQLLRNTESRIKFQDSGNGKTNNPFVTFHGTHQYSCKDQCDSPENLLSTQTLDDKIPSIIPIPHHLHIAEHHSTQRIQIRRKLPPGDLQHRTCQQQDCPCHRNYIIRFTHSSNTKISSSGFFIK